MAGTIRTDGATVAATLLVDAVSREKAASVRVNQAGSSSQGKCRNRTRSLVVRAKNWRALHNPMENPPNLNIVSRCEGHVSTQGYEEELRSERSYVAGLYTRLDAERARVKGKYNAALRGNGGTPMERDVEVRALAKEVKRLDLADASRGCSPNGR